MESKLNVIGRDNDRCPWICLAHAKESKLQPGKGVKEGRPTGPSPHVRVTQGCMQGTKED